MKLPTSSDYPLILHGDCVEQLGLLPDNSVDAVVTDPPYGLAFMGKEWDAHPSNADFQAWCETWLAECLRVLKPGGHLLAFGGTRTWHRLTCAVEDTGFEIRDSIAWMYGSGFPKSLNVGKAIDAALGVEREVIGTAAGAGSSNTDSLGVFAPTYSDTAAASAEARQWDGWGTALKPAFEPIVVARKPLSGTVAANVLEYGTGGINIDGTRVDSRGETWGGNENNAHGDYSGKVFGSFAAQYAKPSNPAGRWPANVVLDEYAAAELDRQSGTSTSRIGQPRGAAPGDGWGMTATGAEYADIGGASRFFYTAKASQAERPTGDGEAHPTVKPLALMQWLIQLVTPPGGIVVEPFAGSGTTVEATIRLGVRCVAIERDANYLPLIHERIQRNNLSLFGGEPA